MCHRLDVGRVDEIALGEDRVAAGGVVEVGFERDSAGFGGELGFDDIVGADALPIAHLEGAGRDPRSGGLEKSGGVEKLAVVFRR